MANDKLIVALDFHNFDDVKKIVNDLGDSVNFYKVGMELFYSVGTDVVNWLKNNDKKIFLDLKLHDIPNTVANGLCSLMNLNVDILNIHASGGFTMMKTASERLKEFAENNNLVRPKLIAITVLTSINQEDWEGLGFHSQMKSQAIRLAKLTQKAELDGIVASPQEAKSIREACGENFLIVTPGIRPAGAAINDQSRISTPAQAIKNGASHLVVGRPIIAADNPREAALNIIREIESVN